MNRPLSPGLSAAIVLITLILLTTLLICLIRRRSQKKLYLEALTLEPALTRTEFRRRRKEEYANGQIESRTYELDGRRNRQNERRLAKARYVESRRARVRSGHLPILTPESWPRERTGSIGVGRTDYTPGGNVVPFSLEWREQQAVLMRERLGPRDFERGGGPVASAWADDVHSEMDIGLRVHSGEMASPGHQDVFVEVPRRTAPPTRRPAATVEIDGLPAYTAEVLPPYKFTSDP